MKIRLLIAMVVALTLTAMGNKFAAVIRNEQAALDLIGQTAWSLPVVLTQDDELQKAEAKGDYQTTLAIKSQQMVNLLRP
jgi:hypothetical protein